MANYLLGIFLAIPGILIVITIHSYVRAYAAYKLGDKSQKMKGNLTLDPFSQMEPIGLLMMVLVGFGWSRGLDINKYAFKNAKKDSIKVSIAALCSFIVMAIVGGILYVIFGILSIKTGSSILNIIGLIFSAMMGIAINLFIFNLIPMPGLDMFNIIQETSPATAYKIMDFVGRYQMIILLAIVILGSRILAIPNMIVTTFVSHIINIILGIFM